MIDFAEPPINTLFHRDNLELINALPTGCVDLCCIDPPFQTGRKRAGSKLGSSRGGRSLAAGREEDFSWSDCRKGGEYLEWLRPRLAGMVSLLKPTGALVVHLDWRMSHYVKVLLDELMGGGSFVNEIIWHYASGGGQSRRRLARKHDTILWYAKAKDFTCNRAAAALPRGRCRLCGTEVKEKNHMRRERDGEGRIVRSIRSHGKVYTYCDDDPAPLPDVWLDIAHLQQRSPERTGYPTQKPLALLERLVLLCSNPGDFVADFFMGTGTTLAAAALHDRKWLGCDLSAEAVALAKERLDRISKDAVGACGESCR